MMPQDSAPRWRGLVVFVLVAVGAIVAAHLLDRWAYAHVVDAQVYEKDWGRLLRVMGYLPTWLLAAAALGLCVRRWGGAIFLALGPALAGLLGEGLKLVVRRQRPVAPDGAYVFRAWAEKTWSTGGLGLPSSHAVVAFAAAFVLCRLYPRGWPIWLLLAVGCAGTRVLARAHFLSDVVVAGVLAYAVVWALRRLGESR